MGFLCLGSPKTTCFASLKEECGLGCRVGVFARVVWLGKLWMAVIRHVAFALFHEYSAEILARDIVQVL